MADLLTGFVQYLRAPRAFVVGQMIGLPRQLRSRSLQWSTCRQILKATLEKQAKGDPIVADSGTL